MIKLLWLVVLLVLLGSCASPLNKPVERNEVELTLQQIAGSGIPEFTAVTHLNASLSEVMSYLMDFSGWPAWVYGCKQVEVLQMIGYQEAYVYQATRLPLVSDRDVIIHASLSFSDDGDVITIEFEAASDFCVGNERSSCDLANQSEMVRVTDMSGRFVLQKVSAQETRLTWVQHMEPGGLIPDWATRWMLPRVPVSSLQRLKEKLQ